MQTLKNGSSGNDVILLQKALNKYFATKYGAANTIKLKEDGDFGANTDKAVRQFQSENKLEVDGVVGDNTWKKINALASSAPSPTPPPASAATPGFSAAEKERFTRITGIVIDQLEGGYYHPNMNSPQGKLKKHYDYLDASGETMFGIDRLNGAGSLANSPAWGKFWGIIDAAGASKNWDYNSRGGAQQSELTALAIEIMAPHFMNLAKSYLGTNWARVGADERLLFHFAYASWNGAGWFKKFANDLDKALKAGITDSDRLAQVALDSRMKEGLKPGSPPNELLVKTGKKIEEIFKTLKKS